MQHYLLAALTFAYLGHPLEPTSASAAEPLTIQQPTVLTDKQMDEATAGAFNFKNTMQFAFTNSGSGCRAFRSTCTTAGSVATSTNGNVTTQYNGP